MEERFDHQLIREKFGKGQFLTPIIKKWLHCMTNDSKSFHANIEAIVEQYEQLVADNAKLRNENAVLKAQISVLQKSSSSNPQNLPNIGLESVPYNITRSKRKINKARIQVDWVPVQYDFPDSVLCVHASKETIAFGTADASVLLFSLQQNQFLPIAQYHGHTGAINCITSDPSTELFASCSGDGTVHIWSCLTDDISHNVHSKFPTQSRHFSIDSDTINSNLILSHHNGPVLCARWLSNGQLVTGSSDATVCFWDVAHSQNYTHVETFPNSVLCMDAPSISQMSNSFMNISFAVGLANGEVRFFDPRTNGHVASIAHTKGQIISCGFDRFESNFSNSPDKKDDELSQGTSNLNSILHFLSAGSDKSLRQWDLRATSDPVNTYDIDHVPTKIDVVGGCVIVPCETGRARFVNLRKNSIVPLGSMPFSYTVSSCSFIGEDPTRVVLASWDGSASMAQIGAKSD
ncbi:hypothetical protein TRFO_15566 [Tritrichomonas foetus]|uniref:Vps41 beta-propeller domain-containing protein n=1 Tax=Tritrichomonas foetus TaxID=1144522 RepID=A0A1J4KS10_9EUKA|nr:hypothetical protein TRFO_15566 [Tritrichomonas foetus]|eukprot:OHT14063.1 hypothetical protein TRFO_15566 [Tritrichomonas foetus]